ncbi:hypothetical protein MTO96_048247 [Rhipicephalus appendiculatus]
MRLARSCEGFLPGNILKRLGRDHAAVVTARRLHGRDYGHVSLPRPRCGELTTRSFRSVFTAQHASHYATGIRVKHARTKSRSDYEFPRPSFVKLNAEERQRVEISPPRLDL